MTANSMAKFDVEWYQSDFVGTQDDNRMIWSHRLPLMGSFDRLY
jgi:hypothetical protein